MGTPSHCVHVMCANAQFISLTMLTTWFNVAGARHNFFMDIIQGKRQNKIVKH